MRKVWAYGLVMAILIGGGILALNARSLPVTVVSPERDVPLRLYGLGTVEARVLSQVGFEVGASVVSLTADAGDRVEQGRELAALQHAEQAARVARASAAVAANRASRVRAEATIARAQAVLDQRRAANHRQKDLARKDVTSIQRAEEAQRDEDVARAELDVARADLAVIAAQGADTEAALALEETLLAQYRLHAPYDAVIATRHAEPGEVVKAGDPIFTLFDPASVWIQAYVDEERAGQIALDQPGTIRLRSMPQATFHGRVARIGLESDRANEERRVWLSCTDCPETMYLGEQAEVRILTGTRDRALMVPELAIAGFDGHRGTVWVVREGRFDTLEMTFGARDDKGRVEVTSAVPNGVRIVARPASTLVAGGRARIVEAP
ncbi:HlyD family secretion protein [Rhodobacter sp. JA431]|uniref:HlyD family secretion protein n=1 Tax=Phaeovulum vinaykumarii TaxID=407234 RepID=A0A1N7MY86_9RHOB|nr:MULTISPECIES: efflux RND transporter periplasmic adaptor subunit [Paracoccaceae]SIS90849.1 HlyD family secretion protein [Phaeovulum vinaykumarii]SOC16331.1 HlyD family secretion protein [Rhodobacter sp. JA431]